MRITSKGHVTIPIEIREQLGLLPNTDVEFSIDRGAVRMTKVTRPNARSRGRDVVRGSYRYRRLDVVERDARRYRSHFPSVPLVAP
jgi:AbrB family looped-hinge helix DNA binding protein